MREKMLSIRQLLWPFMQNLRKKYRGELTYVLSSIIFFVSRKRVEFEVSMRPRPDPKQPRDCNEKKNKNMKSGFTLRNKDNEIKGGKFVGC